MKQLVYGNNEEKYIKECIESVINQYLTTVKPMYYAFIKPTKRYADIIIPNDSTHDVAVDCIARMINDMLKGEN